MNEKHEETAQRIYKVVMLVLLTAFITFMITSLSLYTIKQATIDKRRVNKCETE